MTFLTQVPALTSWAPTRLTSCIFHPGPTEAYERLRSTLCPARAPFHHLAAPGSTRKPLLHTRGISRARSFDLEVTPWAPTRLTSCISHPGPEESSGASTLEPGPAQPPFRLQSSPEPTRKPLLHTLPLAGRPQKFFGLAVWWAGTLPCCLSRIPWRAVWAARRCFRRRYVRGVGPCYYVVTAPKRLRHHHPQRRPNRFSCFTAAGGRGAGDETRPFAFITKGGSLRPLLRRG